MRITNNFNTQYVSNYKKTAKQEKTDTTFSDMLNKATENTAVKSPVPIKTSGIYTAAAAYSAPQKALSIYDIPQSEWHPRLEKAVQASEALDTTGMTQAEIVNEVESIFADYLGKDFLDVYKVYRGKGDGVIGFGVWIKSHFFTTIQRHHGIPYPYTPQINIERKGLAGLSDAEMRAAVRSGYPENMTLKDCLLMMAELAELGLENNDGSASVTHIFAILENGLFPLMPYGIGAKEQAAILNIYNSMLDKPASFEAMKADMQTYARSDGFFYFNYNYHSLSSVSLSVLFEHLLSVFGGTDLYSNDMIDELMKILDRIQKN